MLKRFQPPNKSVLNAGLLVLACLLTACSAPGSPTTAPLSRTLYFSTEQVATHWGQHQLRLVLGNQLYQSSQASRELSKVAGPLSRFPIHELQGFSPDGQSLLTVVSSESDLASANQRENSKLIQRLYLSRADGSNPRQLAEVEGRITQARWSPSGQTIAYVSENYQVFPEQIDDYQNQRSSLHVLSPDDPQSVKSFTLPLPEGSPEGFNQNLSALSWYPGSQEQDMLLQVNSWLNRTPYSKQQLLKLSLGQNNFSLVHDFAQDQPSVWASELVISPDGQDIYLLNPYAYSNYLLKYSQGKSDYVSGIRSLPVWSPDGQKLAWVKGNDRGEQDIQICNQKALDCRFLTQTPDLFESRPFWSADSRQLGFLVLDALDQPAALGLYNQSLEAAKASAFSGQTDWKAQSSPIYLQSWNEQTKQWQDKSGFIYNRPTVLKD